MKWYIIKAYAWDFTFYSSGRIRMKFQGLLENRRFFYIVLSIFGFSLVLIGINLFMLGANKSPATINNIANVMGVLIASIFAIQVWLTNSDDEFLNMFWGLLAIGLAFWTIAEGIWLYLSFAYSETPFPSLADLFWLLGYVPVIAAFVRRHSRLQVTQTPLQRMINILVAALFITATGFFVIWPTIAAFDPAKILESFLNLAYPLTDLTIIILVLRLFFSTQTGRFSVTWQLLGFGFLAMTIADLMFSYGDWNGIYYPDGNPTLFSIVLDVLYYNSYLLIAIGILAFGYILAMDRGIRIKSGTTSLTKSSILIFVDKNNQIISFSDNFLGLVNHHNRQKYMKLPLSEALGISSSKLEDIKTKVLVHGSLSNQALTIKQSDGSQKDVWLTAVAIDDHQNQMTNIAIVLRTNLEEKTGEPMNLTPEQEGLVNFYLSKAGTRGNEEKEILQDYYLEQIRLLYSIIRQFSGVKLADGLAGHLNQIAKIDGWRVSHEGQEIKIPEEYDVRVLGEALAALLKAARLYAVESASSNIIDEEMKNLDKGIKPDALQLIDRFKLREFQPSF